MLDENTTTLLTSRGYPLDALALEVDWGKHVGYYFTDYRRADELRTLEGIVERALQARSWHGGLWANVHSGRLYLNLHRAHAVRIL